MKHRILDDTGRLLAEVEHQPEDPNHGLPDWYFKGNFIDFEIDERANRVEWWPEIGPAPHWTAVLSQFSDDVMMLNALENWCRESF